MFGMGMTEVLLILAVALIVIGPKKLPEIAKALGRAMGEFKRATNDLKSTINLDEPIDITPTPVKKEHLPAETPPEETAVDAAAETEDSVTDTPYNTKETKDDE